jgi:2-dehydropantoate 2-reductase
MSRTGGDGGMALRILVVGAGAVGGYFGARLAEAGRHVTFLVRPGRAEQLRRDGLRVISPHGDTTIRPAIATTGTIDAPYDLVLLSVKAYALEAAMEDFAPAVGPETMILPVLNGMSHVDRLARRFGEAAVIGGVCHVATQLDDEGRVVQIADIQKLAYGERSGHATARLKRVDATLRDRGFEARLSENIVEEMWEKWVQLASLGAVTCLMRGTIGEIEAQPGGADLSLRVLDECRAIATACGHEPGEAFLARARAAMTQAGSPLTSSMYRDLTQGRRVEFDHILGDLLGRGAGVAAPLLEAAFVHLRIYQARISEP